MKRPYFPALLLSKIQVISLRRRMAGFVLIAVFSLFVKSNAMKCFDCKGTPYPRDCLNIKECNSNEICFTEQVVTTTGNIIYNSGCLNFLQCSSSNLQLLGKRSNLKQRSTDISTCNECCVGDFCNNQGCGTQIVPLGTRGPYCFSCDTLLDPKACSKVAVCDSTEQCMLYAPAEFGGLPETVYRSQCEKKESCAVLSQAFTNNRCPPTCCGSDFCNDHCGTALSMTTPLPYTTHAQTQPASVPTKGITQGSCKQDHLYDDITGLCIKIDESSTLNYANAKKACESIGDTLLTIDKHEKTVFIENMILHHSTIQDLSERLYYTGAQDIHHNGAFYWSNHQKMVYTNWGGGDEVASNRQPDGGSASDPQYCVILYGPDYYKWHDDVCSNKRHFICEDRSSLKENTHVAHQTDSPPTPHTAVFQCNTDDGYVHLKDSNEHLCVHILIEHASWDNARAACKKEGGDLVVLDNAEKAGLMRNTVNHNPYNHQSGFWIGAKDFSDNNQFSWVNGHRVTYGDWHRGQPNHHDGGRDQNCACMWSSGEHYQWHDDYCPKGLAYICERK